MGPLRRLFRLGLDEPSLAESVDWEIDHYLAEETDRLVAEGMTPDAARREAERRFGNLATQRRRLMATDRRGMVMRWKGTHWIDVRSSFREALRSVRRSPGFTTTVVLTLGLGLGVNAAMFGVVDRLLLSPPEHVVEPDNVRRVLREAPFFGQVGVIDAMAYPDIVDLRGIPGVASAGATTSINQVTMGTGLDARQIDVARVTHDYITTLGARASVGRFFAPDDDQVGAPLTAVVSHEFWEGSLGADPDVLGGTLTLDGFEATVIGVAPPGFTGIDLARVDVWLPAVPFDALQRGSSAFLTSYGSYWLRAVVRLEDPSVTAAVDERATALTRASRATWTEAEAFTTPLIQARGPNPSSASRVALWAGGVSLFVLLLTCANVANLLLARGTERRREVAVRLSLGVSRVRLVRERVLETLLLALAGGLAALALAHVAGGLMRRTLLSDVHWPDPAANGRVVALIAVLSIGAGVLAGLGPAIQGTRADLARDLAAGGRGGSRRKSRTRTTLTVAQAAISTALLVGAGLFLRSLTEARGADLGLDVDRLVLVRLELEGENEVAETTDIYEEAMRVASGLPRVAGVAATDVPFGNASVFPLRVPGYDSLPVPPGDSGPFYHGVTPGYASTLGLRLLRGREITELDGEGPRVAVVNETMANALWPNGDAIGQCFYAERSEECTSVIGVVEDASWDGLEDGPHFTYHVPLGLDRAPEGFYVRTDGDARELAAQLAPVLRSGTSRVRFAEVQTLRSILDPQMQAWTIGAALFTAFGLLALLVASIGLYSVLAFEVAQQRREIGIRSALGAARARLLRRVLLTGTRTALVGVLIGLGVSLAAARFVQDLLFRVEATDSVVFGMVPALLLAVAAAASLVPALRAARVHPAEVLRSE